MRDTMRTLRASRIAYDAEVLRVRLYARRLAARLVLAVAALAFLGCTMTCAHVAAWYWLRLDYGCRRASPLSCWWSAILW